MLEISYGYQWMARWIEITVTSSLIPCVVPHTHDIKVNLLGIPDTSFNGLNTLIALNVLKSTSKSWGTMNVIHLEKREDD